MNKEEVALEGMAQPSVLGLPLKYVSLMTLAAQNALLSLVMHHSRVSTAPSEAYSAGTAVLMVELLKGVISFMIAYLRVESVTAYNLPSNAPTSRSNPFSRLRKLGKEIFKSDCWKLSIPAILYVIQNNLQYIAAENLDAATFQVTYQMKILTTAGFSVLLLHKSLNLGKWVSLLLLAVGVGIVQIQSVGGAGRKEATAHLMNPVAGFLAVLVACCTSGLAGVYFEMVLKNTQTDLWIRNVQLSLFSLIPAALPIVYDLSRSGYGLDLFHNFGGWAWSTVFIQVFGGLITALVIKYADNILKGFATSLSIVISCLASVALFDFPLTFTFALGASVVLVATWMYNQSGNVLDAGFWRKPPTATSLKLGDDVVMIPLMRATSFSSSVSTTPTAAGSPREKSRSLER